MTAHHSRTRIAVASLAAALLLLAGAPAPAAAQDGCCPCWEELPEEDPIICHDRDYPIETTFAYFSGPPVFLQVTPLWCRANGLFKWVNQWQADACRWDLLAACGESSGSRSRDSCNL